LQWDNQILFFPIRLSVAGKKTQNIHLDKALSCQ